MDHWVFERSLQKKQGSRWRVAGRLSLPREQLAEQQAAIAAGQRAASLEKRPAAQQAQVGDGDAAKAVAAASATP